MSRFLAGFRWPGRPMPGRLLARPNRFLAVVDVDGSQQPAHVPDPGRLEDLLYPGAAVWLLPSPNPSRKTRWTVVLAESRRRPGTLVCTDSLMANRAAERILALGLHSDLPRGDWRAEVSRGSSRFDFALFDSSGKAPRFYLEVKAVTHVRDHCGLFPDAPTKRGTRHVEHLASLKTREVGTGILFCAREDAETVAPFEERDPDFAEALRGAARQGVLLAACRIRYDLTGAWYLGPAQVRLECD